MHAYLGTKQIQVQTVALYYSPTVNLATILNHSFNLHCAFFRPKFTLQANGTSEILCYSQKDCEFQTFAFKWIACQKKTTTTTTTKKQNKCSRTFPKCSQLTDIDIWCLTFPTYVANLDNE